MASGKYRNERRRLGSRNNRRHNTKVRFGDTLKPRERLRRLLLSEGK